MSARVCSTQHNSLPLDGHAGRGHQAEDENDTVSGERIRLGTPHLAWTRAGWAWAKARELVEAPRKTGASVERRSPRLSVAYGLRAKRVSGW